MRRTAILFLAVAWSLAFSGCASVGKKFNYENRTQLSLGRTTASEARSLIGEPYKSETKTNDDGKYETFNYTYAHGSLGGAAARVLFLEFKDSTLNAFVYNSGFREDATEFDFDAVEKIVKGTTKQSEVVGIMGEPSGRARCPSTLGDFSGSDKDSHEVWLWIHTSSSKGLDTSSIKSKSVRIAFDADGVVTKVSTSKDN